MSKVWKWILGIVILLVILAVPVALYFASGHQFAFGPLHGFDGQGRPPLGGDPGWRGPMGGYGFGDRHGPMFGHRGFGFMPFFGPFMLVGGLVKLVIFGLLLYGAYWLGKRNARVVLDQAPAAPAPRGGRKVAKS